MRHLFIASLFVSMVLSGVAAAQEIGEVELGPNANLRGIRLLPKTVPWNQDISGEPVDPKSDAILARIGLDKPLHADFGSEWEGVPIGIPYAVVGKDQKRVPVEFEYADESDAGPNPIPPDAPIEGGPNGEGDRLILVLDRDAWKLYELFNAFPDGNGGWKAGSGAIWDLKQNQVRAAGWTSADAAGLPILPGLVRYDETVEKQAIEHALRFTLSKTRRAYVLPASHWASQASRRLHSDRSDRGKCFSAKLSPSANDGARYCGARALSGAQGSGIAALRAFRPSMYNRAPWRQLWRSQWEPARQLSR
jgi:hypothetical protein